MLSRILIATTLLVSSLAHAEKGDIVIGQIINFSGDQADTCRDYLTGAQVLFDAINIKGGIHGRRISLSQRFEGNSPTANQKLAEDLVNREGAIALFGLCGGPAARQLVESGWIKSAGVPLVGAVSGAESLKKAGPARNVFMVRASFQDEAKKLIKTLNGMGVQRVAVISSKDEYGQQAGQALLSQIPSSGLQLATSLAVNNQPDELIRAARHIANQGAQAVLVATPTISAATFVAELKSLRPGTMVYAMSEVNHNTLIEYLGSPQAAQGIVISALTPSPYYTGTPIAREHARLMKQFRDEPPSHASLEGFIAAQILVRALKSGGFTPEALSRNLAQLGNIDLGGYKANLSNETAASSYVDVVVVSGKGQLLN